MTCFSLGRLLATPGALDALTHSPTGSHLSHLLARHLAGDWGDICPEDAKANDWSLRHDARLLSSYHLADGTKLWIITEADRSATTVLLPVEY